MSKSYRYPIDLGYRPTPPKAKPGTDLQLIGGFGKKKPLGDCLRQPNFSDIDTPRHRELPTAMT
jgi:hypothetical protein